MPVSTCETCGGDGVTLEGELCPVCFGCGSLPPRGVLSLLGKELIDLQDKVEDVLNKCNDILEAIQS